MNDVILNWLGNAGAWAWHAGILGLVVVNAVAVAVVSVTRDRRLVDRWTGRWLAVNLGLIGLGAGTPIVTGLLRLAINALPSTGSVASHLPK